MATQMCILSDSVLRDLVFRKEEFEEAKKWFKRRDWASINKRILISPFSIENLGPFSYDLCIGDEAFSVRTNRTVSLDEKRKVLIKPQDVFLVLTQEYIGLPPDFAASLMPRFSLVRKGLFQSMAKIDPSWFGKVAVGIVNHSGRPAQLVKGQPFCTLVIQRLEKPCSRVLNSRDMPALGEESMAQFLRIGEKKRSRGCLREP
jgi:deoxycytidine triphosphate deaminase